MSNAKFHIFRQSLVVTVAGKTITISKDDPRYLKIMDCIRSNNLEGLSEIANADAIEEIRYLLQLSKIEKGAKS